MPRSNDVARPNVPVSTLTPKLIIAGLFLGTLLLGTLIGTEQVGAQSRGPLTLREQNPVYQLFFVPFMEAADVVSEGRWRSDLTLAYVNVFEQGVSATHELLVDMERLGATLSVGYGLTSDLEIGARVSAQASGGGVLDPLIEGLHSALGLSNGSREDFPSGVHDVFLRERGGRVLYDAAPQSLAVEDLQLFGRFQVSGGEGLPRALSLRAAVKVPTASAGLGSGNADAALSVLGRRSYTQWHFHGMVGLTRLSAPELLRPLAADWGAFWGAAVERRIGTGLAGLVQLMGSSRYLGGIGATELDMRPLIAGFGLTGGDVWRWQVAFVEDIPPNSPSVDFTVHLQLSTVWE